MVRRGSAPTFCLCEMGGGPSSLPGQCLHLSEVVGANTFPLVRCRDCTLLALERKTLLGRATMSMSSQHGVLLAYGSDRGVGAGPAGGVTVRKVVAGVWLFSGEFLHLQKQPGTGRCRSVTYVWAVPKPTASERL